ncbi:hypothetical protein EMIHUDRAFT_215871 [Emiliania huxleyi CCMP1516]|uniref:Uncharacterized protein n=2 Tax=Emiliania huxleyi TaxID=2903 RepID=A0A0D3IG24_EMIH1|nr:hypothetical protein EMIHUDRAFT_215871 [Emiliania huxleyi CCMP1516]EOD10209.1 hypothetical protein EMIHUDRAFT_215871 [Emiliania huxleyi CCMP1516]|eukprot:XP_005762638.1 hypothetical protein EMIHUDRAFT_215871 [Emiliania huxleyi CCMP1516]
MSASDVSSVPITSAKRHGRIFVKNMAVLEGWQRAYERADEATLGVAVSALARLACNSDGGAGFNSGLRSALGSFLAGFAALCLEESLSVEQRLQRAGIERLLGAALSPPVHAGPDAHGGASLRATLLSCAAELTRRGSASGGEARLVPKMVRMATIPSGASESSRVEMAWRLQEVSQPVCAAARQRLEEEFDSSSRLGSIRLLHALWEEFAAAAAPEGEQDAQQQGGWRKALAALGGSVMNAAVGACMYDAVGKARDRDRETRRVAFRVVALFTGEPDAELPPSLCDPDAVAMLVERARNGAGSTDEMCGLAARVFWSFVISHVPDPASALVKLRVAERISLYEPLLRERASELFGAQFDDAMLAPGDDGEQDDGDFADPP